MEQEHWKKNVRLLGNMEKIVAVISVVNFLYVTLMPMSEMNVSDYLLIGGYAAILYMAMLGVSVWLTGVYRDLYGAETEGDPVWDWAHSWKRVALVIIAVGSAAAAVYLSIWAIDVKLSLLGV